MEPLTLKELSNRRIRTKITDENLLDSLLNSTKSGFFSHENDAETEVFFNFAAAITVVIGLLTWLISLTGFWFIWFIGGLLGIVPAFFTCALGLSLLTGFVSEYRMYRKQLKEARQRGLIK
jgi:fatty acid desaturase